MFPGCLQDFARMFSGCSDESYWPGGIWCSFQMKVWTLKIQRNPMIPNYSMVPAIRWSQAIWWSIGSMDFDNPKVYSDTPSLIVLFFRNGENFGHSESLYCDNIELSILIIQGIPPFQPIQQSHPRGRSGRWKGQIAKWENLASQFSELVEKVIIMARIMIGDQGSGKGGVNLDPLPI